jgi:hypothetical protein
MRRTSRFGVSGALVLVVALSFLVTGAHAAGATATAKPRIHLSQASNLASGQIVTVNGYHFDKRAYAGILQCSPGATSEAGCESISYATTFDTSARGSFSQPFQVFQDIVVDGRTVDCVTTPGCFVAAGLAFDPQKQHANQKISFNPKAKPLVPTFEASPWTKLAPNQRVTLGGSNFKPDSSFIVRECEAVPDPTYQQCDFRQYGTSATAGATGELVGYYRVSDEIDDVGKNGKEASLSCDKPPRCELAVFESSGVLVSRTLRFNPNAAPLLPSEGVAPTSGLADGQIVNVVAGGFPAGENVGLQECEVGTAVCANDFVYTKADSEGSINVQFPVIEVPNKTLSCDVKTCEITVYDESDPWFLNTRSISFNASASPVVPGISVAPATGITDGSVVSVSVTNFPVGAQIAISECAKVDGAQLCWEGNTTVTDASGSSESGLQVFDSIPAAGNPSCSTSVTPTTR